MLHQFTREHGLNTQVLARMLRISTFEIMALHCAFSHHPDSSYRGDLIDQTRSDSATQIDQLLLNLRREPTWITSVFLGGLKVQRHPLSWWFANVEIYICLLVAFGVLLSPQLQQELPR